MTKLYSLWDSFRDKPVGDPVNDQFVKVYRRILNAHYKNPQIYGTLLDDLADAHSTNDMNAYDIAFRKILMIAKLTL